jgi:hypothetical protein
MEPVAEHARGVVQDVSVDLAQRHDQLQGVAGGVLDGNAVCDEEGEGAPAELLKVISLSN